MSAKYDREAARLARIKRIYGLSPEQYAKISRARRCKICLRPWSETVRRVIDHSHKTGEVRSADICGYCNHWVLGNFEESDIETLRRIIKYLKDSHTGWFVPEKPKKKRRKTSR